MRQRNRGLPPSTTYHSEPPPPRRAPPPPAPPRPPGPPRGARRHLGAGVQLRARRLGLRRRVGRDLAHRPILARELDKERRDLGQREDVIGVVPGDRVGRHVGKRGIPGILHHRPPPALFYCDQARRPVVQRP